MELFTEESLHKGNKCLVTIAYNYVEKEKSIEYEYYPMIVRLPDVDKNLIMFSGNAKNQLKVGNSFFSPTKESGEILLLNADGEISKLTQKKWDISIRGENGIVEKHRLEDLLNE